MLQTSAQNTKVNKKENPACLSSSHPSDRQHTPQTTWGLYKDRRTWRGIHCKHGLKPSFAREDIEALAGGHQHHSVARGSLVLIHAADWVLAVLQLENSPCDLLLLVLLVHNDFMQCSSQRSQKDVPVRGNAFLARWFKCGYIHNCNESGDKCNESGDISEHSMC